MDEPFGSFCQPYRIFVIIEWKLCLGGEILWDLDLIQGGATETLRSPDSLLGPLVPTESCKPLKNLMSKSRLLRRGPDDVVGPRGEPRPSTVEPTIDERDILVFATDCG